MTEPAPLSPGAAAPGEGPLPETAADYSVRGRRIGEILFAAGTIALGIYALVGAATVRIPGSANALGPQAFPYAVGAILTITGGIVITLAIRGRLGVPESGEDVDPNAPTDWIMVAKLVGIFAAHALLIPLIGWPLAAGFLFAAAAWSLGAKRWWQAALTGLALGLVVQLVFGTALGLSLPPGPLLDWVPFF